MRISVFICAMLLIAQAGSAQRRDSRGRDRERSPYSPAAVNHSDTGDFTQDYSIFQDLNIFVRERHARRTSRESSTPPRTPEQTFVLTGIVQDDNGEYHANFENLSSGGLVKVSVGNSLARGKVAAIEQDQIAYEANHAQTWVQIGNNLTGATAGMADTSSSGGAVVDPNAPGLTIEQRMRARRMQQMNGGGSGAAVSRPAPTSSLSQQSAPPAVRSGNGYDGPPAVTAFGQSATVDQNGVTVIEPAGATPAPAGAGPANTNNDNNNPSDPSEPIITHNFPALPGEAPQISPGN